MHLAIVLILSIGCPALYFVAAIACGKIAHRRAKDKCRKQYTYCADQEDHDIFAVGAGLLWPLYILGCIANYIANYNEKIEEKREDRRKAEIARIQHESRVTEAKKQADHTAKMNELKRKTEEEAALQKLLREQSGLRLAEDLIKEP